VGLAVTDYLAGRFGSERKNSIPICRDKARRKLGLRDFRGWSREETLIFDRWAPLLLILPGVSRWPASDRRALLEVVRAKGGRRESDYVRLFDAHLRLRGALEKLVRPVKP
jgi:hypothetical protein